MPFPGIVCESKKCCNLSIFLGFKSSFFRVSNCLGNLHYPLQQNIVGMKKEDEEGALLTGSWEGKFPKMVWKTVWGEIV